MVRFGYSESRAGVVAALRFICYLFAKAASQRCQRAVGPQNARSFAKRGDLVLIRACVSSSRGRGRDGRRLQATCAIRAGKRRNRMGIEFRFGVASGQAKIDESISVFSGIW